MSRIGNPVQHRLRTWIAIGAAVLTLLVPSVALADTASFSSRTPGSGATTTNTRPTVSVKVYDRHGIRGSSNIYMSIDGKAVKVTTSYIVAGGFDPSHPDYRRIKISYRPASNLGGGTHKAYVKVKDRRGYWSRTTWYFKVNAPEAPYTAEFSAPSPANLSNALVATPTISVAAYDKYGVSGGLNFSLKVDGIAVPTGIRYATSGVYTSFTLSYKPSAQLAAGTHTITASVTDLHANVSTYTWSFAVLPQAVVYDEMPYEGTTCADCHVGYPSAHPMTNCRACHGTGRPVAGVAYSSSSTSAHTLSCSRMSPCHRSASTFPHVLGACSDCHDGSFSGIPVSHSLDVPSLHQAPAAFCIAQGCHLVSLTKEHYRYTKDGARLSCATCHASADTAVKTAISGGSTACVSCHDLTTFTHPGTSVAHAASNTCVRSACHVSNVTSIHKGNCAACHDGSRAPSTQCTSCHATGAYHTQMATKHTISNSCTAGAGCHTSGDLSTIHTKNLVQHCEACHAEGKTPSNDCISCHGSELLAKHANASAKHTGPDIVCTNSGCHGADVTAIHKTGDTYNCVACHKGDGSTPTTDCTACHASEVLTAHAPADPKHIAPAVTCIGSECHVTNVSRIHVKNGVANCYACHDTGTPPIKDCAQCHPGDIGLLHAKAAPRHVASLVTCVSATCHGTDVSKIHVRDDGTEVCGACHHGDTPPSTTNCTACHAGDVSAVHTKANALHVPPSTFCRTTCHAQDVGTIHSGTSLGCAACHSGPTPPATTDCYTCHAGSVQTFHASHSQAHLAESGTCVAGGICHTANVLAYHDPDGSGAGCWKCHDSAHAPLLDSAITCSKCHAGDVLTIHPSVGADHAVPDGFACVAAPCHQSNVMTIHDAAGTGPGCPACHDGIKTPSVQCADCHSTDPNVFHGDGNAPHVIEMGGGCSTSTCHPSANAAVIHQDDPVSCSACHSPGATAIKVCATCHAASTIPLRHTKAASLHQADLATCVRAGCHVADVMTIHASGPGCMACHGASVTPTLVCTTSGCHVADTTTLHEKGDIPHTTTAGYCVRSNCHGGYVTTIHDANGTGPGCAACHDNPDHPLTAVCTSCHAPSQAVVHAKGDVSHTATQTTCAGYTGETPCHGTRVDDTHRKADTGCMSCHGSEATPSIICATCHTGALAPTHASAETSHTTSSLNKCTGSMCHGTNVMDIHAKTTKSCLACHGPDARAVTTDCIVCHAPHNLAALHASSPASETITVDGADCGVHACSECHASDLRNVHGGAQSCPTCHTDKVSTLVGGTWDKSCEQGACHTAESTKPMHANVTGAHILGTAPKCTAAGCHEGGSNVAAIHAPKLGCATCHGGGKTPTLDCATSGCHPSGAPSTHASHDSTVTAGNITINLVDYDMHACSDCHSPLELQTLHGEDGSNNSCAKCHPSPASTAGDKTFTCSQGGCHTTDSGNMKTMHGAIDAKHIAVLPSGWSCTTGTCHGGTNDVAKIHAPKLGCATCHGGGKTPTLACQTAGCHATGAPSTHDSHDSTVTAGNITINTVDCGTHACSECHGGLDLQVIHGGSSSCTKCHPGAADATTGDSGFACEQSGCHVPGSPYAGAVHAAIDAKHTLSSTPSCVGTGCHGGGTDVAAIHRPKLGCATCHGDGKTPTLVCETSGCHSTNTAGSHASHPSTQTVGSVAINGTTYNVTCSLCHASLDLQAVHGGASSCSKCHPSPADTATKGLFNCVQGGCHTTTSGNMQLVHNAADSKHTATVPGCTTNAWCHPGGSDVAKIHSYTPSSCSACHGAGKTPTLVCATAGCHPGDVYASHVAQHDYCNGCHFDSYVQEYHSPPAVPWTPCSDCHGSAPYADLSQPHDYDWGCDNCH